MIVGCSDFFKRTGLPISRVLKGAIYKDDFLLNASKANPSKRETEEEEEEWRKGDNLLSGLFRHGEAVQFSFGTYLAG